jgi:hypothetical protein
MREEENPTGTNKFMEINGSFGGLGLEIGSNGTKTESRHDF